MMGPDRLEGIPMRSNKRAHARVTARNVAAHVRANGHASITILENISAGGVFVRTGQVLPVGTTLSVQLARPGLKEPLFISGKVVRANEPGKSPKPGMSIAFDAMEPQVAKRLEDLLGTLGVTLAKPPLVGEKPQAGSEAAPQLTMEVRDIRKELEDVRAKLTQALALVQTREAEIARLKAELSQTRMLPGR